MSYQILNRQFFSSQNFLCVMRMHSDCRYGTVCFTETYRFLKSTGSAVWDMPSFFSWCISSRQYKIRSIFRCRRRGVSCPANICRNKGLTWGELCPCVHVVGFHYHRYPSFCEHSIHELLLQWTTLFMSSIFAKAEKYTTQDKCGEAGITNCLDLPLSQPVYMPCSYHTEWAVLLMLTFYP
jgi:hypothetical protein